MIWTMILGVVIAQLCGGSTVERLLVFFGYTVVVGVWDIIEILKKRGKDEAL